jgi:hypothetical protein
MPCGVLRAGQEAHHEHFRAAGKPAYVRGRYTHSGAHCDCHKYKHALSKQHVQHGSAAGELSSQVQHPATGISTLRDRVKSTWQPP